MAHLTLVLQGREVRKFVLNSTVTTIGRAQDNDIVINNLALSRRHAQVERRGNRYEVSDLGSQNGVYVNSERVRGSRTLDNTDTITLGTYHFVFSDAATSDPDVESVRREKRPLPAAAEITEAPRPREKEPEPEHVPLLVLKYNEVELQRFPLKGSSCLVGRAKECEVQIPERRLSRKHCEIVREGDRFFVLDLGSQNGTYVNRKRIRDRQELFHEDVLNFAEYSVLFLGDVAEYDGPDLVHARREAAQQRSGHSPGPRPGSGIAAEETAFPEAYSKSEGGYEPAIVGDDRQVHPSDMTDDPEESGAGRPPMSMMPPPGKKDSRRPPDDEREPLTEDPRHARERRGNKAPPPAPPARPARERPEGPNPVRVRGIEERGDKSERPEPRVERSERDARSDRAERAERGRDRPDRAPERGADRAPERGADRAPERSADRAPERGAERDRNGGRDRDERERNGRERDERPVRDERGREERDDRERDGARRAGPDAGRAAKRPAGRDAPPPARTRYELEDVPDEQGDVRPDSSLNDWYDAREERPEGLEEEDSSVLLRGKSSVSQILSTMMVDKKELDRNLSVKARQRRFFVDVRWGEEKIYSGPLKEQVTILGTDREADIQLKGRYVAGRHSILVRVKDSLLLVRLGSSSATRVNGLPKLQAFLKSGDVIQIDETTITVSED